MQLMLGTGPQVRRGHWWFLCDERSSSARIHTSPSAYTKPFLLRSSHGSMPRFRRPALWSCSDCGSHRRQPAIGSRKAPAQRLRLTASGVAYVVEISHEITASETSVSKLFMKIGAVHNHRATEDCLCRGCAVLAALELGADAPQKRSDACS